MKSNSTQSNKPSTSHADSVPGHQQAREAGRASQEQQETSNNTSGLHSRDAKQQGGAPQSSIGRQQQADTGSSNSKTQQSSPSRDQGYSPSGSSKNDESSNRSDSGKPRQTGKNH